MPPLSVLIKPASGNCDLNCRYCFYHSVTDSRSVKNYGIMSLSTLEKLVKSALDFADKTCTFAFQGGEPTLAGLPFFEKLIEFQQKYNTKKVKIFNCLQTNGVKIDEKWAIFFKKNDFLIGLSLDGGKDLHDLNRFSDEGSFSKVIKTSRLFDKTGVEYNILSVVTKSAAKHARQTYNFFKKQGFKYLQFIPCLDPLGEKRGENSYSLTPKDYENFLKTTFDLWKNDIMRGEVISIRYFDNILGMVMGRRAEACGMSGVCSCQFVIEADGSVYPCDFYVTDEWNIGSILSDSFPQMRHSDVCEKFIKESDILPQACLKCKYHPLCKGGCKRDREPLLTSGGRNYFCESFRAFFEYSLQEFQKIAAHLSGSF